MKIYLTLLVGLILPSIQAQIASASLFREMRSQNPAVITQRPAATLSIALKRDQVDKEQDVTGTTYTESTSDIGITTSSFFYGGKGGGITTEFSGELSSGKKTDKVFTSGASENTTQEADMMVFSGNIGLMKFLGIGIMRVSEDRTQSGTSTASYETTVTAATVGTYFNLGLDIGLFYTSTTFESTGQFSGSPVTQKFDMPRIGAGVGKTGKTYHFEIGYVTDLNEISEDQGGGAGAGTNVATYKPSKFFGAFEFKLGKIMLGVTTNYYRDGFFDFNNLMYYTMVLSANKEDRLENTFNFSLGGDKGHSFSVSVSYSTVESQELPPNLSSGTKYKTTSKIVGGGVSYTYNF